MQRVVLLIHVVEVVGSGVGAEDHWRKLGRFLRYARWSCQARPCTATLYTQLANALA